MVDFHSHILPGVDDGAGSVSESLVMLRESFLQGVDLMVSTSHFYADQEYPGEFLSRRNDAFQALQEAMLLSADVYPQVVLGTEVLYFPGIADAEEMKGFAIEGSDCILVEPPMAPWSDDMLDEIASLREKIGCTPIIAHVDRYMQMLRDSTLMERVCQRNMAVQVNAEYFLDPKTLKAAVKNLKNGNIQLIGSDCHNMDYRPPNLIYAKKQAEAHGAGGEFRKLHENAVNLLLGRGEVK